MIGDVPSATAILDRFLSDAEVIQITGDSYRLRGRRADKEVDPASQPKSKTSQTRKPGPAAEATEKTA
ncbi:transposase [Rubripirellula tenax]|uniref:Transposase n=1 Tax=Rubripirellula tenax TaxID=2528015 RepID=A0A5C6EJD0_9BACT|nr:ATP-binding protein [Rubripirellula tenax]TWU48938.1 transposase [Rubripirellula tenax]